MSASDTRPPARTGQSDDPASLVQDFNSLLTVLLGNAEGLRDLTAPASQAHQLAESSVEAANRCIALTRRLETVSGIEPPDQHRKIPLPAVGELTHRAPPGAPQRILMVEDDDLLRDFVITILESLGYQVISAENGPHALALLDEYRDFDLLFTDVVMPGDLDGLELARRARQLMPELAILLTSGYHEQLRKRIPADIHRIRKPFHREELAACLHQCFAATRSTEVSDREGDVDDGR